METLLNLHDSSRLCQKFLTSSERRRIEQIAKRYTKGTTLAWEDADQAAYLKVLLCTKAGKFRSGSANDFSHWAVKVARCEIIDLVRQHKRQHCDSLDQPRPGTDLSWLETSTNNIAPLDALERSDLLLAVLAAITQLNQRFPERGYLTLWQGRVAGKTQAQLAVELGVKHQSAVSKRWKKLVHYILDNVGR